MVVSFFVEGKPQGKARPRFAKGRAYTPKATVDYERKIAGAYNKIAVAYDGEMLHGSLWLDITAFFGVPKSYTKKQKEAVKNGVLPTKKPDADNIAKVVLDALNGVAYEDDKQVVELRVSKIYSFEKEGLDIQIGAL